MYASVMVRVLSWVKFEAKYTLFCHKSLKSELCRKKKHFRKAVYPMSGIYRLLLILSLLLPVLGSSSCQSRKETEFQSSKIYRSVRCDADTSFSYALMLPKGYTEGKPCPVLILFDSHGDGLLPVNLFHAEADRQGFIIAGSNNSKNGMTSDQTQAIYRAMLADLSVKFTLEKKALYLCGFSGGSRVAGGIALSEGNIAGVVGCGAGMPGGSQKPLKAFSYLGVAGNQDFNLSEMKQLDASLDQAGFTHHLLVFDGIHQWPPESLIPELITWIRFDAMRQGSLPADRKAIDAFIETGDQQARAFAAAGNTVKQLETYQKMAHFLAGLTDVTPLLTEIKRLTNDPGVVAYRQKQNELLTLEQNLQQNESAQLTAREVPWWEAESQKLSQLAENKEDPERAQVYKRLLGFLSLNCYMYSNSALKQGNNPAALKFIRIYQLVDPTNAEHRYMAARVAARENRTDDVFKNLSEAVSLGFKDSARMKAEPDFRPFQTDSRFSKLIP
jgi:hypothetical protein